MFTLQLTGLKPAKEYIDTKDKQAAGDNRNLDQVRDGDTEYVGSKHCLFRLTPGPPSP